LRKHNYILGFDDPREVTQTLPDLTKSPVLQDAARAKSLS